MSTIVAEAVSRHFSREPHPAVDQVSFQVDAGNLVVLLGPSGCGKTTLLKMINRLYEPTSGHVSINGADIRTISVTELRRRIGYVIQHVGLFPHMLVEQNIATVPELLGWQRRRIDQRIDELLDLVRLPRGYRKRYPRQLSGGEQQRVGIARALAADPAILLMDEPFGALDAITRMQLQDELLAIQHTLHKTILFVTHDVDEAMLLADKIIIMRAGAIVQYDTPLHIIGHPHDAFVRDLLGTEDMFRRLSLISIASLLPIITQVTPGKPAAVEPPAIGVDDNLRSALSLLLRSGATTLSILGRQGERLGALSFADLQVAVRQAL